MADAQQVRDFRAEYRTRRHLQDWSRADLHHRIDDLVSGANVFTAAAREERITHIEEELLARGTDVAYAHKARQTYAETAPIRKNVVHNSLASSVADGQLVKYGKREHLHKMVSDAPHTVVARTIVRRCGIERRVPR